MKVKLLNMKPGSLVFAAIIVLFLASCGASQKDKSGGLNDKKVELQKLKTEQQDLAKKIQDLETEIAKVDTSAAVVKAKLVGVTPLTKQEFTHYIDLQGKVNTDNIYIVTPRGMGGQVTAIYVKEGQEVRKGQLVLRTDDALPRQQLEQAKIQLSYLEDIYNRRKTLWDKNIGTEVELLTAKNNVANAEKQIALLNEQLQMSNVYAEASGIVESVNIRVGETFTGASANMAGITIVNRSDLKASVDIPENYLGKVNKGTDVVVEVPDINKKYNSSITLVSQLINANSRSFKAEAKLPKDPLLKPNQLALVKIRDYAVKDVIVVPLATVQSDEKGKYVFVMGEEKGKQVARKKSVQVGEIYGEHIEIKQGLNDGELLVSQGFQELYEGQPITNTQK